MSCAVCHINSLDQHQLNGPYKTQIVYRKFYRYKIEIKVCYYHDIEVHILGEKRFLEKHPALLKKARELQRANPFDSGNIDDFEL